MPHDTKVLPRELCKPTSQNQTEHWRRGMQDPSEKTFGLIFQRLLKRTSGGVVLKAQLGVNCGGSRDFFSPLTSSVLCLRRLVSVRLLLKSVDTAGGNALAGQKKQIQGTDSCSNKIMLGTFFFCNIVLNSLIVLKFWMCVCCDFCAYAVIFAIKVRVSCVLCD